MSIATCSGYGAKHVLKYMDKVLGVYGFTLVPPLELNSQPGDPPTEQLVENEALTVAAFQVLLDRIQAGGRDEPALDMLIPFGIFKRVSEVAKDMMPADYEYYKDKESYYYDVRIPFLKKWLASKVVKKELSNII